MAKRQNAGSARISAAAEIAGRALGKVAGTVDSLKARHPHPITEAHEALAGSREKLTALTSEAGARATVVVKKSEGRGQERANGGDACPPAEREGDRRGDPYHENSGEAREEGRPARSEDGVARRLALQTVVPHTSIAPNGR